MQSAIKVFLLTTRDIPNLSSIAECLNNVQKTYLFKVVSSKFGYFRLQHESSFGGESASISTADWPNFQADLRSYIRHQDWMTQIKKQFIRCKLNLYNPERDLLICVGAATFILDYKLNYKEDLLLDEVQDAKSCVYDWCVEQNTLEDYINCKQRQTQPLIAAISVIKFDTVFGSEWKSQECTSRALLARYITINIAHFLGARSFSKVLARRHEDKDCIMDHPKASGSRRANYYVTGFCDECKKNIRESSQTLGVLTENTSVRDCNEVLESLEAICLKPKDWGRAAERVRDSQKVGFYILSAMGLSLFTNLLAGWDIATANAGIYAYSKNHMPAIIGMISSAVAAGMLWIARRAYQGRVPLITAEPRRKLIWWNLPDILSR